MIPLLTSLQARSRPLLWGLTGVVLVLSGVGYLAGIPGEPAPFHNRIIAAASMLVVAWLGSRWMAAPQGRVPAPDPAASIP